MLSITISLTVYVFLSLDCFRMPLLVLNFSLYSPTLVVSIDLIGWLPLNQIASLDASLSFILF
jgi:hypothetical protein